MNTLTRKSFGLLAMVLLAPAGAQSIERRTGEHPAIIVQRLHAQQGYDYASKFYPHPAWLHLRAEAPRPMMEHPAVAVFKRHQREASAAATTLPVGLTAAARH
ncbi:MAG: hypothetical protein KIT60_10475 [Burkholderiaceae bacterium]|nr:hypothetical protein [Burkholderiaceae bacterium]